MTTKVLASRVCRQAKTRKTCRPIILSADEPISSAPWALKSGSHLIKVPGTKGEAQRQAVFDHLGLT
ncbi:hypothetical protein [uncultured Roseobacter sp.]|uniref:hypothetical protein n=1 Tax=uncultured Roseobacter sp. TaxID=114847 RepID=UPI002611C082|nr:hypothetical protein [uncultured Roseobacter sp.]